MRSLRLFNMYFVTTISVALVLFLVGLEGIVALSAHELMRHVKENVILSVVVKEDCNEEELKRLEHLFDRAVYCLDYKYISSEQALQEHINNLGEDPQKFLGYNLAYKYLHIGHSIGLLPFVSSPCSIHSPCTTSFASTVGSFSMPLMIKSNKLNYERIERNKD